MPSASTAAARGASWSIQVVVLIGWPVCRIDAEAGPVALAAELLVRDRALQHEDERAEPARRGAVNDAA